MRNSLIFKLMGAFLLVTVLGSLVIYFLASQATQNAFNLYTTRSGQALAQRLAPDLADFYARAGSWQGVDPFIQSGLTTLGSSGSMMGQGHGMGLGRQAGGMMGAMGQRLILADAQGIVVSDTQNELLGKQISAAELKNGAAISTASAQVGTLLVTPADFLNTGSPAGEFINSVNQAILSSGVIAGVIAMLLGALLFVQIIAPLRQLKKASNAIAGGDLSQRVAIRSRDELGELGLTFNHMAESLASSETQRQHMMADVAHELRTPLAAIQGTLEGMQDGILPLDEEQLAALHSETLLLNRLVGDLRLLSLAEAGQLKLELQETSPGQLIQSVSERLKPQALLKNITLQTEIQANLPLVQIDSDRITQVLNNLAGNALRYTPENGTITIRAALPAGQNQALQVSVTDSGPGIDPESLAFVFDRFYRADKSRARSSGGSGLGLAIVRRLVEAHGGSVKAESPIFEEAGRKYGTRFTFTLP